jgi:hypothetical protein
MLRRFAEIAGDGIGVQEFCVKASGDLKSQ